MQLETSSPLSPSGQTTITRPGLLFVLSAPSGTGKDTVINALKQRGADFYVVASVTTRPPRPGESEGNPYHFVSQVRFQEMIEKDELIEHAQVHGNWYGQPRKPIADNLQQGRDVLLKIDVQGAATVREKVPGAIYIFLVPGSVEELVERLNHRQTETEEQLNRRIADAQYELAQQEHYEYIIVNRQGQLEEAVNKLQAIMHAEHCRSKPRYVQIQN
ncbi:guanylate kinase [Dictyobacter alpinus]|uniref:Guanylate kinase n=1 Tax=Dictyobacter alpinus TaxID=2014873 RepID=A0A402B9G7_9CHLR|nr:guanylate kinase [Dictyobacter alpinus]GCE28014.1 guanylate kinase [Dictyobacter alpinus]